MNKFIVLFLFSISVQAAPLPFDQTYTLLANVYTRPISSIDGQKYEWFKADIQFGNSMILRYCLLMGMEEIQKLPQMPALHQVGSYWTNAVTIDNADDLWCTQ